MPLDVFRIAGLIAEYQMRSVGAFREFQVKSSHPHPAERLAPDLSGCLLMKRQEGGSLLLRVEVGVEECSQGEWHS